MLLFNTETMMCVIWDEDRLGCAGVEPRILLFHPLLKTYQMVIFYCP